MLICGNILRNNACYTKFWFPFKWREYNHTYNILLILNQSESPLVHVSKGISIYNRNFVIPIYNRNFFLHYIAINVSSFTWNLLVVENSRTQLYNVVKFKKCAISVIHTFDDPKCPISSEKLISEYYLKWIKFGL